MKRKTRALVAAMMLPIIIFSFGVNARAEHSSAGRTDESSDELRVSSRILELLFGKSDEQLKGEELRLIPGGDVFGARIYQGCVSVTEELSELGLKCGDRISAVDGRAVSTMRELLGALELGGDEHTITIEREGNKIECKTLSSDQRHKLCEVVRDGAAGIGTITYIDPADMSFGGLGHGICDDTGTVIPSVEGKVTGVIIGGAVKGEKGHPGELSGILTDRVQGQIIANTPSGVFGRLDGARSDVSAALPIAARDEVKAGEATIISTVKNGKKASYTVELFDIKKDESGTKCFKIRVTDKTLLALTGGIVRGMSGSPIIQNGKLVGAVTHVMINDPTEGYGIFIENMLNAAEQQAQPKAA